MPNAKLIYQIFQFSLFVILISSNTHAQTEEWLGWRGLHLQGKSPSVAPPQIWSDSLNVVWNSIVPGEGHSSPIISQKNVFLTAAWPSSNNYLRLVFIGILAAISIIVLTILFRATNALKKTRSQQPVEDRIITTIFWLVLGLFIHGLFFTYWLPEGFSASNSGMRFTLWFQSGTLLALSIFLGTAGLASVSPWRWLIGIFTIFWGLFLVYKRPNPEYYQLSSKDILVVSRMYLPIILIILYGILTVVSSLSKRKKQQSQTIANKINHFFAEKLNIPPLIIFILGLFGFGFVFVTNFLKQIYIYLTSGGSLISGRLFTDTDFLRKLIEPATSYPWFLVSINVGLLLILIFHRSISHSSIPIGSRKFLPLLIIAGGINFAASNLLTTSNSFNHGIICLDRNTGTVNWQAEGLTAKPGDRTRLNSSATPTALADGKQVYAFFGSPGLVCFDYSGNKVWENTELPFEGIHGVASSPILAGGHIIILGAMSKAPYLAAINRATGQQVWKKALTPWEGLHGEHRTPLVVKHANGEIIIDWGGGFRPYLNLFDAKNGAKIATYNTPWNFSGNVYITTVLAEGDTLFLAGKSHIRALSLTALLAGKPNCELWETHLRSKGANTSTPVYQKNRLFLVSDNGIATCISAVDGSIVWQNRLAYGKYFSSLISAGENVYSSNTRGVTSVFSATSDNFNLVAENVLTDGIFSTPAVIDNKLYIRTNGKIWCIEDTGGN